MEILEKRKEKNMCKLKRIGVSQLVVGRRYYVECGTICCYVAFVCSENSKSRTYYRFTYADRVENWRYSFGLRSTKSNLKIFELNFN